MISIIAALDSKKGIGKNGRLPWHIPGDLKRLKSLTMGHPIIMGSKTYEAIGRVLPGRTNIVMTHDVSMVKDFGQGLPVIVTSIDDAFEKAKKSPGADEIFIMGGGQIFSQIMDRVDKMYLTEIEGDFQADTFFPEYSGFRVISEEPQQSDGYKYKYVTLER